MKTVFCSLGIIMVCPIVCLASSKEEFDQISHPQELICSWSSRETDQTPKNESVALFQKVIMDMKLSTFDIFEFNDGSFDFFAVKTDSICTNTEPLRQLEQYRFNSLLFEFWPEVDASFVQALCALSSDMFGLHRFDVDNAICSITVPRKEPPLVLPGLDATLCATNCIPGDCFSGLSASVVSLTGLKIDNLNTFASNLLTSIRLDNCNVSSMPSFSDVKELIISRMTLNDLQWLVETKADFVYIHDSVVEAEVPDVFPNISDVIFQNVTSATGYVKLKEMKSPIKRSEDLTAQRSFPAILSPSSFDFGERTEIERPVLTATLRNGGERTIHVTDVIRTCVCANLELSTTNLPPGGSAEVRCTLDPNVFSGPFLKTFFIKTDDPATPSITVPIRGSVRELWKVEPDKWYQMRAGDTNAVLRVKAAPDAPALVRTEILGPDGASFELRPAGEREFDAVFTPGDQPRGQHHWTVNLYPEGAETPALGLHLGKQVGEHWKCVPARLRAPVDGRDFVADLLVKPADGKDLPADVDPDAITLSPVWDHVSIEPLGPPTWRGIPLRLTVGAEMVSSWEFPKTFYLTVPNHGAASVYFEKIVPPTDATDQPGEMK